MVLFSSRNLVLLYVNPIEALMFCFLCLIICLCIHSLLVSFLSCFALLILFMSSLINILYLKSNYLSKNIVFGGKNIKDCNLI